MPYKVEVVADSTAPNGPRLTTIVVSGVGVAVQAMLHKFSALSTSSSRTCTVITATEWGNFLELRSNQAANPKLRKVAKLAHGAIKASTPVVVSEGEWHLPFIQPDERNGIWEHTETARRVSIGRCVRGSHLSESGERDLVADQALFEPLVTMGHISPLEHVATPFTAAERTMREQLVTDVHRRSSEATADYVVIAELVTATAFCGSLNGWRSYRKFVWGEHDYSLYAR